MARTNRRRFLKGVALCTSLVAGCLSLGSSERTTRTERVPTTRAGTATDATPADATTRPATAEASTAETTTDGRFSGPTEESRQFVDLRYRTYDAEAVRQIEGAALQLPYDALARNADDYRGEAIHDTGTIEYTVSFETHDVFAVELDDPGRNEILGSWTGESYAKGTDISFWGEVLGNELYTATDGTLRRVPAVALAAIET
ncbi:MAG: hypothetical protein ABEI96_04560 [Haloarculaceae archaeon]